MNRLEGKPAELLDFQLFFGLMYPMGWHEDHYLILAGQRFSNRGCGLCKTSHTFGQMLEGSKANDHGYRRLDPGHIQGGTTAIRLLSYWFSAFTGPMGSILPHSGTFLRS